MTTRDDHTELRTECPTDIVNVVDAFSIAHRLTRGQAVVKILGEWARERRHEAMLIHRVTGGNPSDTDDAGRR